MKTVIGSTILSQKNGIITLSNGYKGYLCNVKKIPAQKQLTLTTFLKLQGFNYFIDKRKNGYRLKVTNSSAASKQFIRLFLKQNFFEEVCYEIKALYCPFRPGKFEKLIITTISRPSKILIA